MDKKSLNQTINRRTLLTGAAALAAMAALPKPAHADLTQYIWTFGLPVTNPPPIPPGSPIWINNPMIGAHILPGGWQVNPPSSEFFRGLSNFADANRPWSDKWPTMELLLGAYQQHLMAPPPPAPPPQDPETWVIPLPDAYFFGGEFGRFFRDDMEFQGLNEAQGLAVLVALSAAVGVAGAGTEMIRGLDWTAVMSGYHTGSVFAKVVLGLGVASVYFTGAVMAAFAIGALVVAVAYMIPQMPNTAGWPIPEGYRMRLPDATVGTE